jgi:hypothetical protein
MTRYCRNRKCEYKTEAVCFNVAELLEQALDNIKSISTLRGNG